MYLRPRVILYFHLCVLRDVPTSPKLSEALETFPGKRMSRNNFGAQGSPDVIKFSRGEPSACVTNSRVSNANRAPKIDRNSREHDLARTLATAQLPKKESSLCREPVRREW